MKNGKKPLIHFGQLPYEQFKDKLGEYSHLDHNDPKRKKNIMQDMGRHQIRILLSIGLAKYFGDKINIIETYLNKD